MNTKLSKDVETLSGVPAEYTDKYLSSIMDVVLHLVLESLIDGHKDKTQFRIPINNWGVLSCDFSDPILSKVEFYPSDELVTKGRMISQGISPVSESVLTQLIQSIRTNYEKGV